MFCGLCGTRNSRNNKFCRECGTRLEPPAPVEPLPEEEFDFLSHDRPSPDEEAQARELLDRAFRAYEGDRLEEAQNLCQQALAVNPRSTSAHSLLALLYEKQGDIPRAIREYEVVLEINPDSPADRASLNRLRGETEPAPGPVSVPGIRRKWLIPAMAGTGVLLILLVGSLIFWGRNRGAPPPEGTRVGNLLAQGQEFYAQQRYAEALDCFRQALALDPDNQEIWRLEAAAEQQLPPASTRMTETRSLPYPSAPLVNASVPPTGTAPGRPAPSGVPSTAGTPYPSASSGASPATTSRAFPPPRNLPIFDGDRATSVPSSAVPPGPIPAPIVGGERASLPTPAEATRQVSQAPSVAMSPSGPLGRLQPAPQAQVAPAPSPRQPVPDDTSPKPPRRNPNSYIQISVKDAPPTSRPPRRTEPTPRPEPAVRPEPRPRPEPASRPKTTPRSEPAAPPPTPPAAAQRDLLAEAQEHETRALRLSAQGNYKAAIQSYQKALDTAPDSSQSGQVQQSMGLCYQKMNQHHQALDTLKKAEQKLASQEGTNRAAQRALQTTREAIKTSEEYLQESSGGK